jgi:hypothetical protein
MSEIADFINAQYDKRAALAHAAASGPGIGADLYNGSDESRRAYRGLLDAYDEDWILADIESKRRILARHAECGTGSGYCDDGGHDLGSLGCSDLLDLAAPFSDEPGYKEDWAVE